MKLSPAEQLALDEGLEAAKQEAPDYLGLLKLEVGGRQLFGLS